MPCTTFTRSILRAAAIGAALVTLQSAPSLAALGDLIWSASYGTEGNASVDGSGHVVLGGGMFAPTDFGGGVLTPLNFFTGDIFVARFDATGAHVWSQLFTPGDGGSFGGATATQCTTDLAGNIYLAGRIDGAGTIDFGGGVLTGSNVMFVAAFNSAGTHLWSMTVGSGNATAIAASGTHVAFTGYTYGTMDFGGGSMSTAGNADCFVGVFTTAGAHVWSALYGDASNQGGMAMTADGSGNFVLAAGVEGTTNFGGGPLTMGDANSDLALAKFTAAGTHLWSKIVTGKFTSGAGIIMTMGLAAGPGDGLAVAGEASGSVNFGGGVLTATGSVDAYLARFDAGGVHQSSIMYGGSSAEGVHEVSFDAAGNLLMTGTFLSASINFGGPALVHSGGFGFDMFGVLFDAAGAHLWSSGFGSGYTSLCDNFPNGDMLLYSGGNIAKHEGNGTSTGVSIVRGAVVRLGSNYPNPFNPSTTIPFTLTRPAHVTLQVFDARGRLVATLASGDFTAGTHTATWDGRTSARGASAASGVYFGRLTVAGGGAATVRMALIK